MSKRMEKPITEKSSIKNLLKKIKKMLDKFRKVCYNNYSEREVNTMKMHFYENTFEMMFDQAVEELERKEREETENAKEN